MWASDVSPAAAEAAETAGEAALHAILRENVINDRSPAASGRMAMAVYHAVFAATGARNQAEYFADWWANDGGDLEPVPDGTAPDEGAAGYFLP